MNKKTKNAKAKTRTGRPTKLDQRRIQALLKLIEQGNYLITACRVIGIDKSTLTKAKGRNPQLRAQIKKAEAVAEEENNAVIHRERKKNWKAALEFASRRWPKRWGKRLRIEATSIDAAIEHELERLAGRRQAEDAHGAEEEDHS